MLYSSFLDCFGTLGYIKPMKKKSLYIIIYIILACLVLGVLFVYNRFTPFMMDDLWYSTNLATDEPLKGIGDVFESQVWHYLNWGGRSVTHALLQFILMGGELFADILNVIAAAVLALVMSLFMPRGKKEWAWAVSVILMVFLNPSIFYSMIWQSGAVNYLYSTSWILFFAHIYLRGLDETKQSIKGVSIWIILLGLITGWSNENMGPASFCLSLMVILYIRRKHKRRPPLWMFEGAAASLIGSALCILAPGNFVRSEFTGGGSMIDAIRDRFLSMLTAGASFLLPSVIVLLLILISARACNIKPDATEMILMITAVLAYGAMILSPHFPSRACFGIMIYNIVVALRLADKLTGIYGKYERYILYLAIAGTVFNVTYVYFGR